MGVFVEMGNSLNTLRKQNPNDRYPSEKNIHKFSEITYFSTNDVERVLVSFYAAWKRYQMAIGSKQRFNYMGSRVPVHFFPNLEHNPFLPEIAQVFINETPFDSEGEPANVEPSDGLLFLEYLDLLNAMHPKAAFEIKAHYAFRIFSLIEQQHTLGNNLLDYQIQRMQPKLRISPKQIIAIANRLAGMTENGTFRLTKDCQLQLKTAIENENEENGISAEGIDMGTFKKMLAREENFLASFTILP